MNSANIPKPFGMRVSSRKKCYLKKLSKLSSLLLKKEGYRDTNDKANRGEHTACKQIHHRRKDREAGERGKKGISKTFSNANTLMHCLVAG